MWGGVVTIDIFDWNQYFSIAFLLRKINIDEVTHLGRNFPPGQTLCYVATDFYNKLFLMKIFNSITSQLPFNLIIVTDQRETAQTQHTFVF